MQAPAPPGSRLAAAAGWVLTAALLVLGVPAFLRMPPWCDLTLYDMAARAVMSGGVHYRDVFDTNLPGFVWLLVGVRRLFGPSVEAVRAVDLVVVAACVWLLAGLARRAGATRAGVAWLAAGAAAFYPYTSEFNHAQRDVWMLLPALVAVRLRAARLDRPPADGSGRFRGGFVEGLAWGAAVWIKPHVVFPAAAVWLVTARRLAASDRWRDARADLLGNLGGGLVAGGLGVGWLVATGTWPHFVDVFTRWNTSYLGTVFGEFGLRMADHLFYFAPWSFVQPLAVLVAAGWLFDGRRHRVARWLRRFAGPADDPARVARRVLAAFFLAWAFQAAILQRRFLYVHVPETLILFAVFAARRWAVVPAGLAFLVLTGLPALPADGPPWKARLDTAREAWPRMFGLFEPHPLAMPDRVGRWAECWEADLPPAAYRRRQDRLALLYGTFPSITAAEIGEVADELRRLGARDGEVLCWHDSPHAAYLELGHHPRFRFMHVTTTLMGDWSSPHSPYNRMKAELRAAGPGTKYVVSDLLRLFMAKLGDREVTGRIGEAGPDLLPPVVPRKATGYFPYDQPAVFRSGGGRGRYIIHRLAKPIGPIEYDADVWGP